MLEGPSFLVTRDLPNAIEEESQWAYNTFQVIELSKRKREFEEREETGMKRPSRLQEPVLKEETLPVLLNLFPQKYQRDSPRHNGVNFDSSSLHHDIGRDLSLNSLLNCSSSENDYIASDKPDYQRNDGDNQIMSLLPVSSDYDSIARGQSDYQCHSGDNSYSNSLVYDISGLDLSLNSLFLTSRSDHGSIVSMRPGTQHQSNDIIDSSSLIHEIGRDLSINCLLNCSRSEYGSIASLNRSFRSLIRSGEIYRLRRQIGIIEHWVYLSCNLLQWEAFDPIGHRWMSLPLMNSNECFMCADKESLAVGTQLLVFGKQIDSLAIYKYSILTNSWSSGTKLNTSRCLFGSASLGEIAIIAGGCDLKGNILSSAELYNSEMGTWEILPSMNKPRKLCSAVFMDGKFYVLGGIGRGNPNADGTGTGNQDQLISITSGEVYDPSTKTWGEVPDMYPLFGGADSQTPVTSKAPPLLAVVKNELYSAFYAEKELWKYDKQRNLWIPIGKLPEQPTSLHGWGLAFRACGNLILVIGGPRTSIGGFIEIHAWEPNEGPPQWTLLGRKNSGNFVYNCAVMGC